MNKKPCAAIYTLGCRTNQYESNAIAEKLVGLGFNICDFSEQADVYIINTCSVTAEADRKSRQMIRRGKKLNPEATVIVTGCFSQLEPRVAAELGADFVCGNRNKLDAADYALKAINKKTKKEIKVPDIDSMPIESMLASQAGKTRAFIKIEDGCDNRCAYCIIRTARGGVVSREPEDITREAKKMVAGGVREIVITGTEIASYGRDSGKYTLADAIAAVGESGAERIRIGSVEPSVINAEFVEKIAAVPAFLPSFHLSLQSGSDRILAAMRRKYNSAGVLKSVELIRAAYPDAEFSADIIVGFPGEGEDDFECTMRLAESIGLYHIHIFPYSDRRGTEATKMGGKISAQVKNDRFDRLDALSEKLAEARYGEYIKNGKSLDVLFEEKSGEYYVGHAQNMLEVKVKSEEDLTGRIFSCVPREYLGDCALCEPGRETDGERIKNERA
ncbi:MAG: tRNA (N(6)-L-threonylcarbamoyladenosine(37)-C(2))-methylthiotransferase MtaB [Clostridia bacterium]|nr:tRNA (N(6)-L-threonylcarbamoyladenosine(37)-C(2))-methylthiotransferase MtaB [Clostridia bacterium]